MRYTLPIGAEITQAVLRDIVREWRAGQVRLKTLYDYYIGAIDIDKGEQVDGRPNNHAYSNLAKYIVDTATGYFVGVPPTYTFDEPEIGKRVQAIFDQNDETAVNFTIAESMSVYGRGYDLLWLDEQANVRITPLDPRGVFCVYSNTIESKLIAAIRVYPARNANGSIVEEGELYTDEYKRAFSIADKSSVVFTGAQELNHFGKVPITEYLNNSNEMGDFEWSIKNIEQYNVLLSNVSDDLQSVANAYLAISGMSGTEQEDIDKMNKTRIALLDGPDTRMEFVVKQINDTAVQNHKDTLRQDILLISGVPDLSDDWFAGNSSGVALEYKLWGLDQLRAKKQQGMDKGLFRRLALIFKALSRQGEREADAAAITKINYTRNMPRDKASTIQGASMLAGLVSQETVFGFLEPITGVSVADELRRVEQYEE